MVVLSNRIKKLRTQRGVTQKELGQLVNISQQAVAKWEKGIAEPDSERITIIANYFGVTTDYLLGRDDIKKEPAEGRPIEDMDDSELLVALLGGESLELTEDMIREIKHHARYVIAREREKETQNEAKDS